MKLLRFFPFIAFAFVLGLTSCNEDIDFTGDSVQCPVVYCLLNETDTIHYVKITRTFSGSNNAIEVAQIADSSYYDQVEVKVEEFISNQLTRTWILDDTVITNKEPGAFYSPDQKLYYFKTTGTPLNSNATYKFTANVNNGEFTVKGETKMVTDVGINSPTSLNSLVFMSSVGGVMKYSGTNVKVAPGNAQILDTRMTIYLKEYFAGVPVEKSFVWKLGELNGDEIPSSGAATFVGNGQHFYQLIAANVTNDATITKRQLSKIVITVTGGTSELSKYILVNQPSSSLAQNKPTYTNLTTSDGRPAIGLFSSRTALIQTKVAWASTQPYIRAIDKNSTIELCTGSITGQLLFCSDHPADIAAGESFICQ